MDRKETDKAVALFQQHSKGCLFIMMEEESGLWFGRVEKIYARQRLRKTRQVFVLLPTFM